MSKLRTLRTAFQIPDSVSIEVAGVLSGTKKPYPTKEPQSFVIENTVTQDAPIYTSKLGTPVMANIQFIGGTYETGTIGVNKSYPTVTYDAVLLTVNQAKKIIRTEIQGRDGTVKEYIGMDDYDVTINGIITAQNGVRPVDEIADLKKVLDVPYAIDVASSYLQALGINQLVIVSYNLEQQEGGYSYQTFSINAISDVPQELRLTNV